MQSGKWDPTELIAELKRVLAEHGCTLRSQRQRTGLAHSTLKNWLEGVRPGPEGVMAFARGFGEDANKWRVLAGYDPITSAPGEDSYDQVIGRGMRELKERLAAEGLPLPAGLSSASGSKDLTPEDARRELVVYEEAIRKYFGPGGGKGD